MAVQQCGDEVVRRRRPRIPAGIPYATVEALAADMHGIGADGLTALRARLHSLRRLDFPNGVSGRSGRHFDYGLADVLGVLCALELAEAYVPPAAAVAIVREGWPEIAAGALSGLSGSNGRGVVRVFPNALFQALATVSDRSSDTLHVEIDGWGPPTWSGRTLDLAVGDVARTALARLGSIDPRSAGIARGQVADLDLRFGASAGLPRPPGHDGRLLSDGPYWGRAASLMRAIARGELDGGARRRALWQLGYVSRPAPVDGWKTRVEVHPDLHEIGFAAAVLLLAHRHGLDSPRAHLPADDAERLWSRVVAVLGDQDAVCASLLGTAEAGERRARLAPASAGKRTR